MNDDINTKEEGIETDFLKIYSAAVLEDLGIKEDDTEEYKKIFEIVAGRINARVYLEMVMMLTPEQAKLVADDMDSEKPDPEAVVRKTLEKIPDFAPRMAMVLGKIRSELLEDLKPLVDSK